MPTENIHSQLTGLVQLDSSRLTSILPRPEELVAINPAEAVLGAPSHLVNRSWKKTFQDLTEFSTGLIVFIIIMIVIFMDSRSSVLAQVVRKGFEYVLKCVPMYWVLIVDDCYLISLRKTKTFLAERFQIYFD